MKIFANEIQAGGDSFDTVFLLEEASRKSTRSGGDYWILKLKDKTGTLTGKIWNPDVWNDAQVEGGDFIKVRARAELYKGKIDLNIVAVRKLDPDRDGENFSYDDFIPVGPRDRFKLMVSLRALYETRVIHPGLRATCLAVFDDPGLHMLVRDAPAAALIHQPYLGGLIEHISNLCDLVETLTIQYGMAQDSRDLLFAACLFHDIGKVRELKWKQGIGYTDEGSLIGHVGIGLEIMDCFRPVYWDAIGSDTPNESALLEAPPESDWGKKLQRQRNLWMHLRHLVASHHGQLEWRAIAKPQSCEAHLFHLIDMVDSRMGMFNQILSKETFDEQGFSGWNARLEGRAWRMPE